MNNLILEIMENEGNIYGKGVSRLSANQLMYSGTLILRTLGEKIGLERAMELIFSEALNSRISKCSDDVAAGENN